MMPRRQNAGLRAAGAALLLAVLCAAAPVSRTPPPAPPAPPASAAAASAGGSSQPIQIQADSGIEWQQNAHVYIARGNAVAIRGTSEVHADTLIAHYRDVKGGGNTGGNSQIYLIEAEGHVVMKRGQETVVGDRAVYDVDRAIAVVTGKGLKLTTANDVVTARDSLEWYDQKQIAVARGDAVAVHNGRTIKADVLTAYMVKTAPGQGQPAPGKPGSAKDVRKVAAHPPAAGKPAAAPGMPDEGQSKISRVDAQGHVIVTKAGAGGAPGDIGRGDYGVYDAKTGIATLIGHVVIERDKDVIRGQRGIMDLDHNISRILPGGTDHRVQGLFVRQDQGKPGAAGKPGEKPQKKAAAGRNNEKKKP